MQTQRGGPDRVSMVETAPPKKKQAGLPRNPAYPPIS